MIRFFITEHSYAKNAQSLFCVLHKRHMKTYLQVNKKTVISLRTQCLNVRIFFSCVLILHFYQTNVYRLTLFLITQLIHVLRNLLFVIFIDELVQLGRLLIKHILMHIFAYSIGSLIYVYASQ